VEAGVSFVQGSFLVFFVLVFGLYWALGRRRWQNALLAVCSAVFYGWVHPWFLILLYAAGLMDFFSAQAMERWPHHRRWALLVSMCGNLGMLGFFKYFDFFLENVAAVLGYFGLDPGVHALGIYLPVGISFYTFQTMSYTIDVYRGQVRARRDLLDYLVFVSFFPQLVAGPVQRAGSLLAQVERDRSLTWASFNSGLTLALWGGFKKIVVADTLAPYVDKVFQHPAPSSAMLWAAAFAFSVQILADFSGYTDIARGVSRMLGFELVENFRHPYLAANPSDFWKRWHISFSSWIRDYLYIPLGGSRGTWLHTVGATWGAMLLAGIWHGAAWNYVLWGAYHATLLVGYRLVSPRVPGAWRSHPLGQALAVILMYAFTCGGWLLFREHDAARIFTLALGNPLAGSADQWLAATVLVAVTLLCASPLVLALVAERLLAPRIAGRPWLLPAQTTAWALCVAGMLVFVRVSTHDFIYFQF
jgi:D-alanyl-lipoteichoic acid acyltransferase DltB (MBOAT superfamily)